jgi:hypothetical protein
MMGLASAALDDEKAAVALLEAIEEAGAASDKGGMES